MTDGGGPCFGEGGEGMPLQARTGISERPKPDEVRIRVPAGDAPKPCFDVECPNCAHRFSITRIHTSGEVLGAVTDSTNSLSSAKGKPNLANGDAVLSRVDADERAPDALEHPLREVASKVGCRPCLPVVSAYNVFFPSGRVRKWHCCHSLP